MAVLVAAPAAAQVLEAPRSVEREVALDGPRVLHVTDWLMQRPEGQEALAEYRRLKAAGLLPYPAKRTVAVGTDMDFRVFNLKQRRFDTITFRLMAEHERFLIWAEVAELDNGHVTQDIVDTLFVALAERTPPGSFNPAAGIIVNDEVVFGDPPNVDGDGKSDVLLVDVRDDYDPDQGNNNFVAGFVTPNDLAGRGGNDRDVLYLDTNPTLTNPFFGVDFSAQTASHEYQHLIHLTYDTGEESFVNEGLSEWAEVVNGYPGRRIFYLGEPGRYNVPFFRLNDTGPLDDRQRALRFMSYLGDLLGVVETGSITRQPASGANGIDNALTALGAGFGFSEALETFHIANLLNDASLDPRYGFVHAQQRAIKAAPTATFDGRFDPKTPPTTESVQRGGTIYLIWDHVEDLALTLNGGSGSQDLSVTALLFQDGAFEARLLTFGETTFPGVFDRVAVVVAHLDPGASLARFDYAATWNTDQQFELQTIIYDDGTVPIDMNTLEAFRLCSRDQTGRPTGVNCGTSRQANRFVTPANGVLTSVALGPYYDHDFSFPGGIEPVPDDAPRDFRLVLWDDDGDGRPGDELFSLDVTDTRASSGPGGVLNFQTVDLAAFQDELAALPDTFFVGITDTGDDENYLVMGVTEYTGNTTADDNVSFLFLQSFNNGQGFWAMFPELQAGNPPEPVLQNRVLPFRASFLVPVGPTASDEAGELPSRVVLYPSFPNPFNPSTTIGYALPQAAEVRLAVYDVLGRRVALLVDGVQAAGEHRVQVEAAGWTSGLYFYTIEAAGQRRTQRMVLIK